MIKIAEESAKQKMQTLIKESNAQMMKILTAEIDRMVRLKKINPSIKEQEINQLKEMALLSIENIKQTQLRLDAIRFIITN
jgi:ATP-dependent helicase HepA